MSLGETDVQRIFGIAFDAATAEEVALSMSWYHEVNREVVCGVTNVIRFSNSYIRDDTQVRLNYPLEIDVAFGDRVGHCITNQLDPGSIRDAVARAEAMARASTPRTGRRELAGPQDYPDVPGFDAATASLTADERHQKVAGVIERLQNEELNGSGYFHVDDTLEAHATSTGLWFYRRATKTGYTVTVRSDGTMGRASSRIGSGWAGIGDMRRVEEIDFDAITATAIDKAKDSIDPQPFEMGRYTVILEPSVTAAFVGLMLGVWSGSARAVGAWGTSHNVGERVASALMTLRTKPDHPAILGSPYGPGGRPLSEKVWVEEGTLAALPGGENGPAAHLVWDGGAGSVEDLIGGVERGLLVTQNWNTGLRTLDPPQVNGMTRNGLFWIENGRVVRPLQNAWFTLRLDEVARNIEAVSRPYKTALFGSSGLNGNLMPAVQVAGFNFYRPSHAV